MTTTELAVLPSPGTRLQHGDARRPFTPVTVAGTPGGLPRHQASHLAPLVGGGARWALTRPGPVAAGGRRRAWTTTSTATEGQRWTPAPGLVGAASPGRPGGPTSGPRRPPGTDVTTWPFAMRGTMRGAHAGGSVHVGSSDPSMPLRLAGHEARGVDAGRLCEPGRERCTAGQRAPRERHGVERAVRTASARHSPRRGADRADPGGIAVRTAGSGRRVPADDSGRFDRPHRDARSG